MQGKESLALSKKWPKMHFEEKILEKKHVYILVTKIYYWNIQRTWNGHQKADIDRFTPLIPNQALFSESIILI